MARKIMGKSIWRSHAKRLSDRTPSSTPSRQVCECQVDHHGASVLSAHDVHPCPNEGTERLVSPEGYTCAICPVCTPDVLALGYRHAQ